MLAYKEMTPDRIFRHFPKTEHENLNEIKTERPQMVSFAKPFFFQRKAERSRK